MVRHDRDRLLWWLCRRRRNKPKEDLSSTRQTGSGSIVFGLSCPPKPGVDVAAEHPFQQQGVAPGAFAPPNCEVTRASTDRDPFGPHPPRPPLS